MRLICTAYWVWPKNPFFQILETIWRIQLTAGHLDPDASARDQEAVNSVTGGGKLGVTGPESLFVPEMNARLVSSFHADPEIASEGIDALNHRVFRIPGQVSVVKVENVVVLDPPISNLPGRAVPGCLERGIRWVRQRTTNEVTSSHLSAYWFGPSSMILRLTDSQAQP